MAKTSKTLYMRRRLREPSTWMGLAVALGMGSQAWETGDMAATGSAIGAVLAMLLPERDSRVDEAEVSQAKPAVKK